jgi:hypothetical protein
MGLAGLKRQLQGFAGAEQMALANHLVQTMRAQGFGQRRGGRLGK